MKRIRLNFLPFAKQDFSVSVFRKTVESDFTEDFYYTFFQSAGGANVRYAVANQLAPGWEPYTLNLLRDHDAVSLKIFERLYNVSQSFPDAFIRKKTKRNRRIHFVLRAHAKGKACVWIEPHFLKSEKLWGVLLGFQFVISEQPATDGAYRLDKDILIASGALNEKGQSNTDHYLFQHEQITVFIKDILPTLNAGLNIKLRHDLVDVPCYTLKPKEYVFKDDKPGGSAFFGLSKYGPLSTEAGGQFFEFIYRQEDRLYAVSLLKGLRGESHPNTFSGMEKMFQIPFNNDVIKGSPLPSFSEVEIDQHIRNILAGGKAVLPVIITNAKGSPADDKLYYFLKSKFTNAGIACQVVTKDLIANTNAIKYSLGNIGLQMFAKLGNKPWKMKPSGHNYLIIGIGQSYSIERTVDGNAIEKNISYSVLLDSSGIFKDLKVLSEGVESESTYKEEMVNSIAAIINASGHKHITLHVPFRISKPDVLEKISRRIDADVELTTLVVNSHNDFFGFDYANNGLVPFESTFAKLSKYDYLVWFEGLQPSNPKITKRFGNPLTVKFWYSNKPELLENYTYRESLLQDCINLSGANWRGFKAKQLPVSVFYCQRIAEFITKFREYDLEHIDINNLKPWFL